MYYLFEESDALHTPLECFLFDASRECFPVKPHWHYFMELLYVLDGGLEVFVNGTPWMLSEGEMLLLHPKVVHSIYTTDQRLPRYLVLKFDINRMNLTPNYAPKLRSIFHAAEMQNMTICFRTAQTDALQAGRLMSSCMQEMQNRQYGYDLAGKALLYQLLIGILRVWGEDGFSVDQDTYAEDGRSDIDTVTEYIDAHMTSPLRVAEIAAQCGMSYSFFAKRFVAIYGKSCKAYINEMRIYKVEEFLTYTDFDLNYISQETGFSDCSHMIKCFKQVRGLTPKQFRLQHRKTEKA